MANVALIGLPAYELLGVTIGPPEDPARPASSLDDPEPWRVCRLATVDPSLLTIRAALGWPLPSVYRPASRACAVGGVALVNHSLAIGAEWRVRLLGEGGVVTTERVVPLSVESLFGFTGAVSSIQDDPFDPDGFALNNDGSSAGGSALVMLDTPALPPVGPQQVRVRVEWDAGVELTEGGFGVGLTQGMTSVAGWYLPPGAAFPPSPHVFQLSFDASQLADPSGGDCVVSVAFSGSLPDGGAGDIGRVRIAAIDWDCRQLVTGLAADSGWMPAGAEAPVAAWGATPPGTVGVAPQRTAVWVVEGGPVEADEVLVEMRDPMNQTGHVDVGRLLVGPAFVPATNRDWGRLVSLVGRDTVLSGDGGSSCGVRREPLRRVHVPLSWLSRAEARELVERLWRAGTLTPLVVALMPSDAIEGPQTTIYGRVESLPALSAASADVRALSFDVVEKL